MFKWFSKKNKTEPTQNEYKSTATQTGYSVFPEEAEMATSGHKLQAINAYRARTRASLADAKNAIDAVS